MKKLISCLICGVHKRELDTYKANVEIIIKSPITGEGKRELANGRICADCANKAGYKVRKELLTEN